MPRRYLIPSILIALAALIAVLLQFSASPPPSPASAATPKLPPAPVVVPEPAPAPIHRLAEATSEGTELVDAGGMPESYRVSLSGLAGRVVDAAGMPVSGMRVELLGGQVLTLFPRPEDWFGAEAPELAFAAGDVTTDDAGRFLFEEVDPDGYHFIFVGHGGPRRATRVVDVQPAPGEVVELGDIPLDPYAVLVGRVVDEFDEPLPGARVRASPIPAIAYEYGLGLVRRGVAVVAKPPGTEGWIRFEVPPIVHTLMERLLSIPETTTDEEGRYRLEGVAIGTCTVIADKEGLLQEVKGPIPTVGGGERSVPDLRLMEGDDLVVRVVRDDEAETPVEGATVMAGTVFPFFPVALMEPGGTTRADGTVVIPGRRDDDHVVMATGDDSSAQGFTDDVAPGDDAVVRLPTPRDLWVLARAPGGEILTHPRLIVRRDDPLMREAEAGLTGGLMISPPLRISKRVTYLEDGRALVSRLGSDKYQVLVKKDGYAIGMVDVDLTREDGEVEITLEAERTGHVLVVEVGTDRPIEHALVTVGAEDDGGLAPTLTCRTDENGVAMLSGLAEGSSPVRAFHPAYASTMGEITAPGPPLRLELARGGSIAGRVTRGGQVPGELHSVIAIKEGDLPRIGVTDTDGVFRVLRLPVGDYEVIVMPRLSELVNNSGKSDGADSFGLGGLLMAGSMSRSTSSSVELEADYSEVEVEEADSVEEPEPASDPGSDGRRASGTVRVGSGPGGADDSPGVEAKREVRVVEGQEAWIDIDILRMEGDGPRARLLGSVVIDGRPTDGVLVTAKPLWSYSDGRSATTGVGGRFDLGDVPADELLLRISDNGELYRETLTLAEGETREVAIRFSTGKVTGVVRSARDGSPLSFAEVLLEPAWSDDAEAASEGVRRGGATESDGTFSMDRIPFGTYVVRAKRTGFGLASSEPFTLASGVPERLTLTLLEAVTVEGTVVLPDGVAAPAYLFLVLTGEQGFGGIAAVDLETRRFRVEGIAPGTWDVHVSGDNLELASVELRVPPTGLRDAMVRPERQP